MGQDELAAFLKRLKTERRLSPHTCEAYERDLRALLAFCEREQIASLKDLDSFGVRRFAAESHRKGLSARSVARRLSAVRTFLNHLIDDHSDAKTVGRVARAADVGTLVLYHLIPGNPGLTDQAWTDLVSPYYDGRIVVAKDLLIV